MGILLCALLAVPTVATRASAVGLIVGSGSQMHLGSALFNLGCNDVVIGVGATLFGDQATINLAGSWLNSGTFAPGTSTVNVLDGCLPNMSVIAGQSTFYNLSLTTSAGKQIKLADNRVQTVLNALMITGAPGNLLQLSSMTPGVLSFLDLAPGGTQFISYVDVRDNRAVGQVIAPGSPSDYNSVDSGEALNWFLNVVADPAPAPALSSAGGAAALTILLLAGWCATRRRRGDQQRTAALETEARG